MLQKARLRPTVLPRTRLDCGRPQTQFVSGLGYVGIALAARDQRHDRGPSTSLRSAWCLARSRSAIGFGLQNVVNNFVSGIILLIEAAHLRGRLDRGRSDHGHRQVDLGAFNHDRDLRQDGCDLAECRS